MKILIDTNIIIDILQKREPFFTYSFLAIQKAISDEIECLLSASAATDIYYIMKKALGSDNKARDELMYLSMMVNFTDVLGSDIQAALLSPLSDFEDAVVDAIAARTGASYILTRNHKDFDRSNVPAITPKEFLDLTEV